MYDCGSASERERKGERERVGWYLPLCKYIDGSLRDALFPFAFFFHSFVYMYSKEDTNVLFFFSFNKKILNCRLPALLLATLFFFL